MLIPTGDKTKQSHAKQKKTERNARLFYFLNIDRRISRLNFSISNAQSNFWLYVELGTIRIASRCPCDNIGRFMW